MTIEESMIQKLTENFKSMDGKCTTPRARRIFAEVPQSDSMKVLEFIKNKLDFKILCTITGLDLGEEMQVVYHLANEDGVVLNLKLNVPKSNPVIETVTSVYEGATFYEREIIDLLGFEVKGLKPGNRYPLPDWWPEGQYPLRKDWDPKSVDQLQEGRYDE